MDAFQEALVEAAVGEEKRRIIEQREMMEKSADEIRDGFNKREAILEVGVLVSCLSRCLFLCLYAAALRFRVYRYGGKPYSEEEDCKVGSTGNLPYKRRRE